MTVNLDNVKSLTIPYYFTICLVVLAFLFWIFLIRSLLIIIRRFFEYGMDRRIVRILSAVFLITLLLHTAIISLIVFHEIKIHRPFFRNDSIQNTVRLIGSYAMLFLNFTIDCLILLSLYTLFAYFFGLQFKNRSNKRKCIYVLFVSIGLYFVIVLVAAILIEIVDMHYVSMQILSFVNCVPIIINIIVSFICICKLPIMKPMDLAIGLYQVNTKCSCYTPLTRYAWSISTIAIAQAIGLALYILKFDIWDIDSRTAADTKWINTLTNHDALLIYFASQLFMLVWFWSFVRITAKQSTDFFIIVDAFTPKRLSLAQLQIQGVNSPRDAPNSVAMNDSVQIFPKKEAKPYQMLHVADFSPMDDSMNDDRTNQRMELATQTSDEAVATNEAHHIEEDRMAIELVQVEALNEVVSSSDSEKSEHFEDIDAKMDVIDTEEVGEMVEMFDDEEVEADVAPDDDHVNDGDGVTTAAEEKEEVMKEVETEDNNGEPNETDDNGQDEEDEEDAPPPPLPPTQYEEHDSDSDDMVLMRMRTPEHPPNEEEEHVPQAPLPPIEEPADEVSMQEDDDHVSMPDTLRAISAMQSVSEVKTVISDDDDVDEHKELDELQEEEEEQVEEEEEIVAIVTSDDRENSSKEDTEIEESNNVNDDKLEDNVVKDSEDREEVKQEAIVTEVSDEEEDNKTDENDMEDIEREILEPIEHIPDVNNSVKDENENKEEENTAQDEVQQTEVVDSPTSADTLEVQAQSSMDGTGTEVVNYTDQSESNDESNDDANVDSNDDTNKAVKPPPNVILEF